MDKLVRQRFQQLEEMATQLEKPVRYSEMWEGGTRPVVDSEKFKKWATSVLNLLQRTFGENSIHYQNFHEGYKAFLGWLSDFENCRGIFHAAKEDYEGGYLFNVHSLIKAEILAGDILEQATELLKADFKDPACVLAGVALESALKELCTREGILHGRLDRMNADLSKASVYNMGMQKQITAWAHHRNKAAHGEWDEYTAADVDSFIKGVTSFIANYL